MMFSDFSTFFCQSENIYVCVYIHIYGLLKVEVNLFFTVTQLQHLKQHCLVPFFLEDQQFNAP